MSQIPRPFVSFILKRKKGFFSSRWWTRNTWVTNSGNHVLEIAMGRTIPQLTLSFFCKGKDNAWQTWDNLQLLVVLQSKELISTRPRSRKSVFYPIISCSPLQGYTPSQTNLQGGVLWNQCPSWVRHRLLYAPVALVPRCKNGLIFGNGAYPGQSSQPLTSSWEESWTCSSPLQIIKLCTPDTATRTIKQSSLQSLEVNSSETWSHAQRAAMTQLLRQVQPCVACDCFDVALRWQLVDKVTKIKLWLTSHSWCVPLML